MNVSRPMAGLTAALCSLGLMTAGAMGAQAAELAASDLPTQIINGGFDYPSGLMTVGDHVGEEKDSFTFIDPQAAQRVAWPSTVGRLEWVSIPGFDASTFGWSSSQETNPANDPPQRAGAVELQMDNNGNQYAEICASQSGTAIYQRIRTTPGAVYTIRLKHASLNDSYLDRMQVMVGAPGKEKAVTMTRTGGNTAGDRVGERSDVVSTRATNTSDRDHEGQWCEYEGVYVADSTETMFTFRSVDSIGADHGNLVDDISFQISWPLTYDLQGGQGLIPNKEQQS